MSESKEERERGIEGENGSLYLALTHLYASDTQ